MVSTAKASYGPQILAPPKGTDNQATNNQQEQKLDEISIPKNIGAKLLGDAAVGTGVTLLMAPFLTIVDKAIAQRAAGTHTLMHSCQQSAKTLVTNPVGFARNPAFLYVWAVYAATYTTANSLKTVVEHQDLPSTNPKTTVKSRKDGSSLGTVGIFLGTSAANSGASLMKDRAFAHMFAAKNAASSVAKQVPRASYGLWMSRDLIGVGSSFVLPDLIARKLPASNPETVKRNRDISQFFVPIATQLVAGPLHLLGLDLFNRPMRDLSWKQAVMERSKFLVNGYAAVVGARIARIIPGYGFGGVMNSNLRDAWRGYLIERDADYHDSSLLDGVRASSMLPGMKKASF